MDHFSQSSIGQGMSDVLELFCMKVESNTIKNIF